MERKLQILHCIKCNKEYSLLLSESEIRSGKYSHHCSRSCANSRSFSNESKIKTSESVRKRIEQFGPWGSACGHHRTLKQYTCKECGKVFDRSCQRDLKNTTFCSKECSSNWRHKYTGGYRKNAGRGKHGWYKGIWCDSSWELAFVIYYIDHGLFIERCKEKRAYEYEGKQYTYNPDFITDDGIVEIKGYTDKRWEAKIKSSPDIKVFFGKDIKYILDYVHNKYGSDIESLYDGYNPRRDDSKKKFRWVHKGDKNAWIKSEELQTYLNTGYVLGRYIK